MENNTRLKCSLSIGTIGLITFIVFLVLKLCNLENPAFDWLTWFWVWFPLWFPIAVEATLLIVAIILFAIIQKYE